MAASPDRQVSATGRRGPGPGAAGLCAVLALLCYANTLGNEFCYDDLPIVVNNPLVTEPGNWGAIWSTDYWRGAADRSPHRDLLYRPLTLATYRLNHALHGLRPAGYHAVNIVLHALVTIMVFRVCRRFGGSPTAATAGGVLFAVLPIHTEAVAAVVGRADLLAALFTLLAVDLLAGGGGVPRALGGGLCVLAALCAKESALATPLLVLLLTLRPAAAAAPPGKHRLRPPTRDGLLGFAAVAVAVGAYLALRYVALGGQLHQPAALTRSVNVLVDADGFQRILGGLQLWGLYWAKTLWPAVLCVDYSVNSLTLAHGPGHPHVLLGLAVLIVLAGWSVWTWRRGDRRPALLCAALLLCYLPVSNTIVLIKTSFAERVWYLPSVWVAMLLGGLVARAGAGGARAAGRPSHRVRRLLTTTALGMVTVTALARCWLRNAEWHDNGTLFAAAWRDHPDAIQVSLWYGDWLARRGDYTRGVELMQQALAIDLGFTDAHRRLGTAYLRAGELDNALEHLQAADLQAPGHPPTRRALDEVRRRLAARGSDVVQAARRAAAENAADLDALLRLADKLAAVGALDEAAQRLADAEPRFADRPAFQHRYAVALVMAGRRDAAVERYRAALALDPDDPTLLVELAMLLLDRRGPGDLDQARRLAERASATAPQGVEVRMCRAELLILEGRRREAAALYRALQQDLPEGGAVWQHCRARLEWLER